VCSTDLNLLLYVQTDSDVIVGASDDKGHFVTDRCGYYYYKEILMYLQYFSDMPLAVSNHQLMIIPN